MSGNNITEPYNSYQVDILFSLISAQAIPNLIHAFDKNIIPRKKIILIHTGGEYKKQAELLQKIINKHLGKNEAEKYVVLKEFLNEKSATSYISVYKEIDTIYKSYDNKKLSIGLNATGGTKVISFAAINCFFDKKAPVFYVYGNTLYNLETRNPEKDKQDSKITIDANIPIEKFLWAYDRRVISYNKEVEMDENKKQIIKDSISNPYLVQDFNNICYNYTKNEYIDKIKFGNHFKKLNNCSKETIEYLQSKKIITKNNNGEVSFNNKKEFEFIHGIWLEEYIFTQLKENKEALGITDILHSVKIEYESGEHSNEIDIVFMKDNKLYFIECKAGQMENQKTAVGKSFSIIKNIKDLRSDSIIISFFEPTENQKQQAEDMNIKMFFENNNNEKDITNIVKRIKKIRR